MPVAAPSPNVWACTLPGNLSFELSRGKTLAKLSANSLGFGIEAEEMRAAIGFRQAGGVKKSRHPPGD